MLPRLRTTLAAALAGSVALLLAGPAAAAPKDPKATFDVLVFSKTAGFRHASIETGVATIRELGQQNGFTVEATEDAGAFTDETLAKYEAVVWLSTTGDVLNDAQQGAFERFVKGGGGYAGIHSAADTEYDWPFYGKLVGAYFKGHPAIQQATVTVSDHVHPSTAHLPDRWVRTDEWYDYRANPRGNVHVLAALDQSTYTGATMGVDHPIAWCQDFEGGRSWYTGGGHTAEAYAEPDFRKHLLGGIRTAAGAQAADCGATVNANYEQVTLAKGDDVLGEPMALAVLPDRRVLTTARDGTVHLSTPNGTTTEAAKLPVYNHDEDGLQGVAIDSNFSRNNWVYLYYAPPLDTPTDDPSTPGVNEGDAPTSGTAADFARFDGYNQVSRFKLTRSGKLDLASEQRIMQVEADRGICCHAGGEIDFDSAGNLLLSTGDDTNPFESDGYVPIDERADRNPAFDAQRTSANSNDLRGKLLRIRVASNGSYTVPAGNLFASGTEKTRPEIYGMGFRNPFRFAVDRTTDVVYLADYGPDAGAANPARGPGGQVEFNRITKAGNYGWPYCHGKNDAYVDYDFGTGASGGTFSCDAPVNESPNNTGLRELSPVTPAWIAYDGGSVPEFGTGSESPMGGPVYDFDPKLKSATKFPQYYDGKFFAYEWGRGWIKEISMDSDGQPVKINPFFGSMFLKKPMNMEFGPEGSLYVLDYGDGGFFTGNENSALYRIDYVKGARAPLAQASATPTSGQAPLTVAFSSAGTTDPDPGDTVTYAWDFDGDGRTDSTEPNPSHTYTVNGQYTARLTATDTAGKTGFASVTVTVGNTAPVVEITAPANGGFFNFGDSVPFTVSVTDPEDGSVDCSRVKVSYILGHDMHGHPLSETSGCQGVINTAADGGHGADSNVFGVISASYTDTGANGVPALSDSAEAVLQPKTKQAEHFTTMNGVQVVSQADAGGGRRVGYIDNGDWIAVEPMNLSGVDSIGYRVSSGGAGGTIELHADSPTGPLVHSVAVTNTGGWDNYVDVPPVAVTDPGGTHNYYWVFTNSSGSGGLFDLDVITVNGPGVATP